MRIAPFSGIGDLTAAYDVLYRRRRCAWGLVPHSLPVRPHIHPHLFASGQSASSWIRIFNAVRFCFTLADVSDFVPRE